MPSSHDRDGQFKNRRFDTTQWSLVLAAGDSARDVSNEALEALCDRYWYPLYAYVRRLGYDCDEARDLTQGFFLNLLEKKWLRAADRERGRFRSFLLASMKHFVANERKRQRTKKRGGGVPPLSLDFELAEGRYSIEPSDGRSPDKIFERKWAVTLLQRVLDELRADMDARGKGDRFDRLKGFFVGGDQDDSYTRAAEDLGTTVGNIKVAIHRLRKRYGEFLCLEVSQTVADPDDVDDEGPHRMGSMASIRIHRIDDSLRLILRRCRV